MFFSFYFILIHFCFRKVILKVLTFVKNVKRDPSPFNHVPIDIMVYVKNLIIKSNLLIKDLNKIHILLFYN